MTIEKLAGTSSRLYELVAPLVMRRSVLRQNNNYPFWTSRAHTWFVALNDSGQVEGFIPVEHCQTCDKINNYYIAGDDPELLQQLLDEVLACCGSKGALQSVTLRQHVEQFARTGFRTVREWKLYAKMEYGGKR